ncbi:MAG: RagB/SusD family nutrient uptake outer membrane protein [Paludibacter sp.]
MKQFFKSIAFTAIAISSVVLSSCDSSKDEPAVISGESVWKTDQEALSTANGAYSPLQRLSSSYTFLLESQTDATISFEGADDKDGPLVSLFKTDVNNWYPTKIFNYLYVSIGEANRTIEKADSSHVTATLTQEAISLAKARAKFIRGLDYLYLTQLWGEVPLILKTKPTTAEQTTRKPIDEVYTQIVKDLTEAEAVLPAYDQIRSNPSKGAANAILARAYLSWASNPLTQAQIAAIATSKTDPATPTWDQTRLQKAIDYANKVINSGNYALEANFENNFGVAAEDRSVEHIFTIHHDGDGIDAQGNHQTHCPFTFRFDLYQDNHIGPADVTLKNVFADSDKRKRFSILDSLYNQDEPLIASPKKASDYKGYSYTFPVTSPRIGKWIHRSTSLPQVAPGTQAGQLNDINRIEIRYAEVLLIKAEALFYQNKATDAATVINLLRTRAGVSTYSTLTQAQLENEWNLELFFEQHRWINLTRWHKLVSAVTTNVPTYEYYKAKYADATTIAANFGTATSTTNYPFFAKVYKHLHAKTDNVAGKFYRFPIPKGLSGNDLGITQNPGY